MLSIVLRFEEGVLILKVGKGLCAELTMNQNSLNAKRDRLLLPIWFE